MYHLICRFGKFHFVLCSSLDTFCFIRILELENFLLSSQLNSCQCYALYVSKNAIVAEANAEIEELKARVTALESALSAATQEHTTQSQRIIQVEQKNASQDDQISEISTKNQSQDQSIQDLLEYINNVNVNNEP